MESHRENSRNEKQFSLASIPPELQHEIFTHLDPFSLANVVRSGIMISTTLIPRALFGGLWTLLLSMNDLNELEKGLTERGNAFLIGYGLEQLYTKCLGADEDILPSNTIHIILTWVYAKNDLTLKQRSFQIGEYNIILWIKKPDILFGGNGITVNDASDFICRSYETKIFSFKNDDYKMNTVCT